MTGLLFRSAALLGALTSYACAAAPSCPPPHAGATRAPGGGGAGATVLAPMPAARATAAADAAEGSRAPRADDMTKASATVDRFHAAAAAADETAYFSLFAEGGVFLGTDAKERWTVPEFRAYAHPRFASGKAWSFRATRRDLSVRGDVAWFDEDLDTPNLGPARGSGVLVRDEPSGAWKIAQYNLSIPIPNERFAEVRKVIEGAPAGKSGR